MMYQDHEKYQHELSFSLEEVSTVGWLDNQQDFVKGEVPVEFLSKLKKIFKGNNSFSSQANLVRYIEPCPYCGNRELLHQYEGEKLDLGSSEIWIKASSDKYYASPSLIIHYIEEHGYQPPQDYIQSVLSVDMNAPYNAEQEISGLFKKAKTRGLF